MKHINIDKFMAYMDKLATDYANSMVVDPKESKDAVEAIKTDYLSGAEDAFNYLYGK